MKNETASEAKVAKIYFGAIKSVRKSRLPLHLKEEFAAYCVCRYYSTKNRFYNFKCAFVDFLREENGRNDTETGALIAEAKMTKLEYDESFHSSSEHVENNGNIERDVLIKEVMEIAKSCLSDKNFRVLSLLMSGMSQCQIADELGVCETRVSQIIHDVNRTLRKKLKRG